MKIFRVLLVICLAGLAWTANGTEPAKEAGGLPALGDLSRVGTVKFPTSCDPAVQAQFERGVALLHSFFYEEARRVFNDVAAKDADCAMAHWGVAMSHYHPLWAAPDPNELAAGLGAVEKALAAGNTSERERAYIGAVEAFYKASTVVEPASPAGMSCHGPTMDHRGRAACFRREMEEVSAADPQDVEAAAFYALSLLGTAVPGDPELANQKQSAGILQKWFQVHKDHPGLAHYLIHSYDYPPLADQGLTAANAYAAMAPGVPHALHMPSHIYTRLGMWPQTVSSNLASAKAAREYAAGHHPDAASFEELHALDYVVYAYLQLEQDEKAKEVLEHVGTITKTHPETDFAVGYAVAAIPARYALERRQWQEAAALQINSLPFWKKLPFTEGLVTYARAVGLARTGDLDGASRAADRLKELAEASTDARYKYFADQMVLQRDAALGLIALAKGQKDEGIELLKSAAAQEDKLGKHPVSPGSLLPIRELLGEALLANGKPAEALAEFEATLKIYPARFNGLVGAAHAAAAAGKKAEARKYYEALIQQSANGDGKRPELAEARAFMGSN